MKNSKYEVNKLKSSTSKQNLTKSPSTAPSFSPLAEDPALKFQACMADWKESYNLSESTHLETIVQKLQESQEQMRIKYQRIIHVLLRQISRNMEQNKKIYEQVEMLKEQLKECNQDINILQTLIIPQKRSQKMRINCSLQKSWVSRNKTPSRSRGILQMDRSSSRFHLKNKSPRNLFSSNMIFKST